MNKSELYELKDKLWKSSLSSGTSNGFSVGPDDCANRQLPFYAQAFNTSRLAIKRNTNGNHDGEWRPSMSFIPLPRESVAMIVDAVRMSGLEDDEKCRFLFEMFDVENRGVLSKEGVRAFVEATFAANGVEFLGAFDYDAAVDKVFDQCRQHDKMTFGEFKSVFAGVVAESDDDKRKAALGRLKMVPHHLMDGVQWYGLRSGGAPFATLITMSLIKVTSSDNFTAIQTGLIAAAFRTSCVNA